MILGCVIVGRKENMKNKSSESEDKHTFHVEYATMKDDRYYRNYKLEVICELSELEALLDAHVRTKKHKKGYRFEIETEGNTVCPECYIIRTDKVNEYCSTCVNDNVDAL